MSTRIIDPNNINKKKDPAGTESTNAPLAVGADASGRNASTPIAGGQQTQQTQQQQPQQQQQAPSSGTFTDLNKYKQAAQNAGNRIAQGIQSKVGTKTRLGESALNATSREFNSAMDAQSGYAATEEGRSGAISNVRDYTASQAGYQQPAAPAPTATPTTNAAPAAPATNATPNVVQQAQNFNQSNFADVINRQYDGVRAASDVDAYQQAIARSQAIKNYAKLINNPNSNKDLLQSTFGQDRQYTQGMSNLDAYLYNKSGAASNVRASDEFKNAQNFDQRIDQTKTELSGLAKARAEAIDKMRNDARQAFTDVAQGRTDQIEDRLDDVKSEWDSLTNMLRDEFYEPGTAGQPDNGLYREGREIITREFEPDTSSRMSGQQAYDYANKHYQNYTNEISDLEAKLKNPFYGTSRFGFTSRAAERRNAEARLAKVKTLKQQAYDAMAGVSGTGRKLKTGGAELSPLAMALLGVGQGTQLFNLVKDEESLNELIKSREYERDRLIGKGEQANLARLEALSKLASAPGMEMDYTNKYFDAKRAGTLTASDALDRENVANKLNEAMDQFEDASQKDITTQGYGHDRYKSGFRSRDIHEYRYATGSVDDVLDSAGYNYEQNLMNPNISTSDIARVAEALNEYQKTGDKDQFMNMIGTDLSNAILPALTMGTSLLIPGSSVPGKEIGREVWNAGTNIVNDLGNKLGLVGDLTGLDLVGSIMGSISRRFGGDKNAKIAGAAARAQDEANKRLQAALTKQLQDSGFYNTIKQGDLNDSRVRAKQQALLDLLARLDSTNRGSY